MCIRDRLVVSWGTPEDGANSAYLVWRQRTDQHKEEIRIFKEPSERFGRPGSQGSSCRKNWPRCGERGRKKTWNHSDMLVFQTHEDVKKVGTKSPELGTKLNWSVDSTKLLWAKGSCWKEMEFGMGSSVFIPAKAVPIEMVRSDGLDWLVLWWRYWVEHSVAVVLLLSAGKMIAFRMIFSFFFQAEDGIRDVERSRGLGDVYKRQANT